MDAVKAEQLPAPVKKENKHIDATLYAPGPARYTRESQPLIINTGFRSVCTSSNGIVADSKKEYSQNYSPPGGFCIYHHASRYACSIHAQISKSALRRRSAVFVHCFLSWSIKRTIRLLWVAESLRSVAKLGPQTE